MRWLILGAGGIGGYYAARLAAAGEHVTVTSRGEHLAVIQKYGLTLLWEGGELQQPLQAVDHPSLIREFHANDFDVLILAMKAGATDEVMLELSGWLASANVPVLSLQNGVDNEKIIADKIGIGRTLGGLVIKIGGHVVAPGVVSAEGEARIVMGIWPHNTGLGDRRLPLLKKMELAFAAAGIAAEISDNISHALWRKLIINNGVNPLSALTGLNTRQLTHHPEFRHIVLGMMNEVIVASSADGVMLNSQDRDDMFVLISEFNAIKTSMLVDVEKRRTLEVDAICGVVIERCKAVNYDPCYTITVSTLLKQNLLSHIRTSPDIL
ncbi:MAG: 2-dehydropantoate 2-reductase [Sphingomonadales bacterium]|nr:2-dehydropantoate 2-reductase [Sphingomonadales bacterium]